MINYNEKIKTSKKSQASRGESVERIYPDDRRFTRHQPHTLARSDDSFESEWRMTRRSMVDYCVVFWNSFWFWCQISAGHCLSETQSGAQNVLLTGIRDELPSQPCFSPPSCCVFSVAVMNRFFFRGQKFYDFILIQWMISQITTCCYKVNIVVLKNGRVK